MTTKGFTLSAMMSQDAQLAMEDVIEVTDACRAYFEHGGVPHTAADMVAMAKLAMTRQRDLADEAKRSRWEKAHDIGDQQDA